MDIVIDWSQIHDMDSFYESLFEQLKSPPWHGRNLNALRDSLTVGDINGVEPPYRIVIKNESHIPKDLIKFAEGAKDVFISASRENGDIEIAS